MWRIWNDPDYIKKWWGPQNFTAPIIRNDARVGGTFLWSMKSARGEMFWNTGVYKQVLPNTRIVSTMSFSDATGKAIPGSQVPVPGHWPNEIIVITEFTESGGKTQVDVYKRQRCAPVGRIIFGIVFELLDAWLEPLKSVVAVVGYAWAEDIDEREAFVLDTAFDEFGEVLLIRAETAGYKRRASGESD